MLIVGDEDASLFNQPHSNEQVISDSLTQIKKARNAVVMNKCFKLLVILCFNHGLIWGSFIQHNDDHFLMPYFLCSHFGELL
jgi:hypothetical protein